MVSLFGCIGVLCVVRYVGDVYIMCCVWLSEWLCNELLVSVLWWIVKLSFCLMRLIYLLLRCRLIVMFGWLVRNVLMMGMMCLCLRLVGVLSCIGFDSVCMFSCMWFLSLLVLVSRCCVLFISVWFLLVRLIVCVVCVSSVVL